jgi:DNA-binding transcriptional regulator YdaS (Cro superfamily)
MEVLRKYLNDLTPEAQENFAIRCGTSIGYLRKAISAEQKIGEKIAIAMERESAGAVRVEAIRPDVDWAYLRGTSRRKSEHRVA